MGFESILYCSIDADNNRVSANALKNIDDPASFMRFVLLEYHPHKGLCAKYKYKKLTNKYSAYKNEISYMIGLFERWGLIEVTNFIYHNRPKDWKPDYRITKKGVKALSWSSIEMFKPTFWSENKKFALTWIIQAVVAAIALAGLFIS